MDCLCVCVGGQWLVWVGLPICMLVCMHQAQEHGRRVACISLILLQYLYRKISEIGNQRAELLTYWCSLQSNYRAKALGR